MTIVDYDGKEVPVTYESTDQICIEEEYRVWFIVSDDMYGVSHSIGGVSIVDDQGHPVNTDDDGYAYLNQLKELVTPEMKAA